MMKTNAFSRPLVQVALTWGWNILGTGLISVAAALLFQSTVINREAMRAQPGLTLVPILTEIIATGALPVLFVLLFRQKLSEYGIHKTGLAWSLLASAVMVGLFFVLPLPMKASLAELNIRNPSAAGIAAALLAAFAYGPLEVFFVIWLIVTTDRVTRQEHKLFSAGLIVTILVYGLLHTTSQGLNGLVIAAYFLLFGLIFKRTRNSTGPMIAWTVMNDFIWFLAAAWLG